MDKLCEISPISDCHHKWNSNQTITYWCVRETSVTIPKIKIEVKLTDGFAIWDEVLQFERSGSDLKGD